MRDAGFPLLQFRGQSLKAASAAAEVVAFHHVATPEPGWDVQQPELGISRASARSRTARELLP